MTQILLNHVISKMSSNVRVHNIIIPLTLLEGTVGTLSKNFIIGWIKKQVKETSDNDFHFGTFTIIAAFGVSDHQAPHIDMPSSLVQIGVSVTAGCDSTAYSISQNPITTPESVV
jgi:hypothetical protein